MNKHRLALVFLVLTIAGCSTETPIRKTNCWSTMTLMQQDRHCEFNYVPAR